MQRQNSYTDKLFSIVQNGIPSECTDIKKFREHIPKEEIGWQIETSLKQTKYGFGIFTTQDVKKGQVLRRGVIGLNMLEITPQSVHHIPGYDKNKNYIDPTTLNYMKNYIIGSEEGPKESVYLWIPGCGINHATGDGATNAEVYYDNTLYGGVRGFVHIAKRDIKKGEEMYQDYRSYGYCPIWFGNFMAKFGVNELLFPDKNDFVGEN